MVLAEPESQGNSSNVFICQGDIDMSSLEVHRVQHRPKLLVQPVPRIRTSLFANKGIALEVLR